VRSNARAYAADPSVLGVLGTYNSGCAEVEIPILGNGKRWRRRDGLARQHADLPHPVEPDLPEGQPASLYPTVRNYARVVPNDAYQGAGLAALPRAKGSAGPTSSTRA